MFNTSFFKLFTEMIKFPLSMNWHVNNIMKMKKEKVYFIWVYEACDYIFLTNQPKASTFFKGIVLGFLFEY